MSQVEDFLTHYGVKGMRWGVRKDRSTRSDIKNANRNLAKQYAKYERNAANLAESLSDKTYASLSTDAVKIKKGQELYRTTIRKDEKLRDLTYVSYLPGDRTRYKGLIPSGGKFDAGKKWNKTSYEHVFTAAKDLSGPSEKARVDAFIELMDQPVVMTKKGPVTGRDYLAKHGYKREAKQLDSVKLGLAAYKTRLPAQMIVEPIGTAYFNSLRKKGYDLLSDDNDRGLLSEDPLILLDTSGKTIKPKSVRRLSRSEVTEAQKDLRIVSRSGVHR